jgi:transposase
MTTLMMLEGAVDGDAFKSFIEKKLVPTLHQGDIVLMDSINTHKGKKVEEAIRSVGAELRYLPR